MSQKLQVVMLLAVVLYFMVLLQMLKKKRLNLKYTLLWIFSGCLMLLIAIYPNLLIVFSQLVGIIEPTNALFAVIQFCGIIILMSLTSIISKMNEQIKRLAQTLSMLEKRVRELEDTEKR